ncbi:glutamate formimidoyltransferase [bacterium (Candidatus Blackallbacteria) CG17_big_fil_post_rev_8_21_14_2_50_48_46]|uniref:glutamate formimidoyltransferase n=1 Tax=bacterium (Candidatus Blackallbacteria) CG17_big_fil_post_rev_8_21_14_2_50_48_46 TaxID=2014261 RepID=A0A2M7G3D3_9BACT|nr:MAG: glutamate formimidoyltransferase [bacterium (Candidatus Blackallbacteria) CG18_big_fil_WC_8_21_14_2_50_49_26]PIW15962.1 MAG: glutamate formimidoyltransferase [bacterium (Candidatus Blackallbacteria) CG17_big_fil_post_rev_8_21_14_2_50_48_46]PIW50374.1 MAG: glutamate formimidoyltransferase [bacterium (Candidatus Blackallbacteria) CG13_big_fil_rev_8_21_14_2_50_49_14]
MRYTLLECVPNLSEGRNLPALNGLTQELNQIKGLYLLDFSADADHHRSVFTLAGSPEAIEAGLNQIYTWSLKHIDLRRHQGAHPRIGAVDVAPLIPLQGISTEEAVQFSLGLAQNLAQRFQIPIFLYESSALLKQRTNLAVIRKGQFEGLAEKMKQPEWQPDFGPSAPHPRLGATALGVREFLIAYNLFFAGHQLESVKALAASLRESSGGLKAVKALGLWLPSRQQCQLSINLTDFRQTSLKTLSSEIKTSTQRLKLSPLHGELIGLIPRAASWPGFEACLLLQETRNFILEEALKSCL